MIHHKSESTGIVIPVGSLVCLVGTIFNHCPPTFKNLARMLGYYFILKCNVHLT